MRRYYPVRQSVVLTCLRRGTCFSFRSRRNVRPFHWVTRALKPLPLNQPMFKIRFGMSRERDPLPVTEITHKRNEKHAQSTDRSVSSSFPALISGMSLVLSLLLPSCSVDPDFLAHERGMHPSPKPDAILGMWHCKPRGVSVTSSSSLLFKANRTVYAYASSDAFSATHDTGDWAYEGDGWWRFQFKNFSPFRCRTDGKLLLCYGSGYRQIYFRPD